MRIVSTLLVSVVAASAALFTGEARADDAFSSDVGTYARGEARAASGRIGLGALSLAGGTAEVATGTAFGRGFGYSLLAGGGLQLAIGAYDLAGVARWSADLGAGGTGAGDGVRLERTRRVLRVRQAIAASLVVAGGLTAYFATASDGVRGAGLGVALESGMLLLGDVFAERRGERFAEGLRRLQVGVAPSASGGAVWIGARY